jgi:hypothetical protein
MVRQPSTEPPVRRLLDAAGVKLMMLASDRWAKAAFILLFFTAAAARILAAPYSATQDTAQFWSFAQLFKQHGLDFYSHYAGTDPVNPWQGWGFVYPPIWLLILGLAAVAAPGAAAGQDFVDTAWRFAMKIPIITADLAIGIILFAAVPGSAWKKLLFASLWLLNPTVWYQSSVFGQFDAIAAAFLLGALVLFEKQHYLWAFATAAVAVLTKQHTLIPVTFMIASAFSLMPRRQIVANLGVFTGIIAAVSLPFMVTGAGGEYLKAVLLPGQAPAYQEPMVYAFSGSGALATYLHNAYGWDTVGWLNINTPVMVLGIIAGLAATYWLKLSPARSMLIGTLIFISTFYRINYQYLVIFIPLAIYIAARSSYLTERLWSVALALFPSLWLWFFNVAFWFNYVSPVYPAASTVLSHFGWTQETSGDIVYVRIALVITFLALGYCCLALTRWRAPLKSVA